MLESTDDLTMSQLFLFLPSITDRGESINQYLKNVSISPLDVEKKKQLDNWCGVGVDFDPSKLEIKSTEIWSNSCASTDCICF